jgi:oligopeptide/dipeptide ABC transporter ATP-binding protein
MTQPVLVVRDLAVEFEADRGLVRAVDGVSFDVRPGEVLAIVGESGCGKTATALAVMGLLPKPYGRVVGGEVELEGQELLTLKPADMRRVRGARVAMIFQDALTALNPVHRVGYQIAETIRTHRKVSRREAQERAASLLDLVGIPNATERADDYVHQFSGGMRQRAMIAMAVALEPTVLIADEPTTALDVTVQAQVLEVLKEISDRLETALILITHDLAVVARMADRVMVMYAAKKVEEAPVDDLFAHPKHPYTWGLMRSIPRLDGQHGERLDPIPGAPPNLAAPPPGCRFAPRCRFGQGICATVEPQPVTIGLGPQQAMCHFADRPDWTPDLDPSVLDSEVST